MNRKSVLGFSIEITAAVMPAASLFWGAATVLATTYYVDASRPNDSGNGLTWETAKKTINAAPGSSRGR